MKTTSQNLKVRLPTAGALLVLAVLNGSPVRADEAAKKVPPTAGASLVGGALPGGAILSAKYVKLTPDAGGESVTVMIGSDGVFRFSGLKPGRYQMTFVSDAAAARMSMNTSVPRQTHGTSFGEKVNSGLQQTGNAVASGAAVSQHAAPASSGATSGQAAVAKGIDSTPARISTNFTVGKQTGRLDVDGPGVNVTVGPDGSLSGRASAATD